MPGPLAAAPIQNVAPEELYNVLCGAASQDPSVVISSANRLKDMNGLFGIMDGLSSIASEKSTPLLVRQQSIIQLKNLISHSWRSRRYVITCYYKLHFTNIYILSDP